MKPIIIYSMGRSRSTATLHAAKRANRMNEPFEIYTLGRGEDITGESDIIDIRYEMMTAPEWPNILTQLNDSDTAVKFFGTSLNNFQYARDWFTQVQQNESHEIFILIRNPKDVIWSLLFASRFGWNKTTEKEYKEVTFNEKDFVVPDLGIDQFLRFYPGYGKVVTFETLPEEFFDYSTVVVQSQDSQKTKMQYVTNPDFVEDKIHKILAFHKHEWYEKTGTDIFDTKWKIV